jgi:hypothetical protein
MRENWEYQAHQGLKRGDDEKQHHLTEMLDFFAAAGSPTGLVTRTEFNGRACFEVEFRRRARLKVREYFDIESGLRVGTAYSGTNAEIFYLDDYKEFDGVKIATRLTALPKAKRMKCSPLSSVEFVDVPDSKFAMPIHLPEWPEAGIRSRRRIRPGSPGTHSPGRGKANTTAGSVRASGAPTTPSSVLCCLQFVGRGHAEFRGRAAGCIASI